MKAIEEFVQLDTDSHEIVFTDKNGNEIRREKSVCYWKRTFEEILPDNMSIEILDDTRIMVKTKQLSKNC